MNKESSNLRHYKTRGGSFLNCNNKEESEYKLNVVDSLYLGEQVGWKNIVLSIEYTILELTERIEPIIKYPKLNDDYIFFEGSINFYVRMSGQGKNNGGKELFRSIEFMYNCGDSGVAVLDFENHHYQDKFRTKDYSIKDTLNRLRSFFMDFVDFFKTDFNNPIILDSFKSGTNFIDSVVKIKEIMEYSVSDLVNNSSQRIYILESPFKEELKFKTPAAGKSGVIMSIEIYDSDIPLGILLQDSAKKAGVLNSCQFPLDQNAYEKIPAVLKSYFGIKQIAFESRNSYKEAIKLHLMENDPLDIIGHLQIRLWDYIKYGPVKEVVVCGIIAQVFFEIAVFRGAFKDIDDIIEDFEMNKWKQCSIIGQKFRVLYTTHPSPNSGKKWIIENK